MKNILYILIGIITIYFCVIVHLMFLEDVGTLNLGNQIITVYDSLMLSAIISLFCLFLGGICIKAVYDFVE